MSDEELEGRLAALELVAALGLHGYGEQWAASGWPSQIHQRCAEAKAALLPELPLAAQTPAARALDRMFASSREGFHRDQP